MSKKRYMLIEFDWVESKTYRDVMCSCKGIEMVYNILRRYVIRDNMDHKVGKYLFDNYFTKGILASSVSYEYLQLMTGMSKGSVAKCLKILKEAKFIEVKKTPGTTGDLVNVFILGKRKMYRDKTGMMAARDFWRIDDIVAEEIFEAKLDEEDTESKK